LGYDVGKLVEGRRLKFINKYFAVNSLIYCFSQRRATIV